MGLILSWLLRRKHAERGYGSHDPTGYEVMQRAAAATSKPVLGHDRRFIAPLSASRAHRKAARRYSAVWGARRSALLHGVMLLKGYHSIDRKTDPDLSKRLDTQIPI